MSRKTKTYEHPQVYLNRLSGALSERPCPYDDEEISGKPAFCVGACVRAGTCICENTHLLRLMHPPERAAGLTLVVNNKAPSRQSALSSPSDQERKSTWLVQ